MIGKIPMLSNDLFWINYRYYKVISIKKIMSHLFHFEYKLNLINIYGPSVDRYDILVFNLVCIAPSHSNNDDAMFWRSSRHLLA